MPELKSLLGEDLGRVLENGLVLKAMQATKGGFCRYIASLQLGVCSGRMRLQVATELNACQVAMVVWCLRIGSSTSLSFPHALSGILNPQHPGLQALNPKTNP